jgi:hypothetical protein
MFCIYFKVFFTTTSFANHLTWWTSFGVINFGVVNATCMCKFLRVIGLKCTLRTVLYFDVWVVLEWICFWDCCRPKEGALWEMWVTWKRENTGKVKLVSYVSTTGQESQELKLIKYSEKLRGKCTFVSSWRAKSDFHRWFSTKQALCGISSGPTFVGRRGLRAKMFGVLSQVLYQAYFVCTFLRYAICIVISGLHTVRGPTLISFSAELC